MRAIGEIVCNRCWLIAFLFFATISQMGCRPNYTVKTFEDWALYLKGVDLYSEYLTLGITYDDVAIRDDLVRVFNVLITSEIAKVYLDNADFNGKTVQELARLKMIGAWREGDTLYVSNQLLIQEKDLGIDEFSAWKGFFLKNLKVNANQSDLNEEQACLYSTIRSHFNEFVLLGPNKRMAKISLDFTLKDRLKKYDSSS